MVDGLLGTGHRGALRDTIATQVAELGPGDSALLVHGVHSVRVLEDMQCISVKQGPFLGIENDKVEVVQ